MKLFKSLVNDTKKRKWLVLFIMCLMIFMGNLDLTIVALALSPIANSLNMSIGQAQWVMSIYFIVAASLMIICGRLGDHFSRKKIFIVGVLLFFVGSALAGMANSASFLYFGRIVQSVGFAFASPAIYVFIFNVFSENQKGLAFGLLLSVSGIAQALGPTIGGILINVSSWRSIFYINLPFCLIILFFSFNFLYEKKTTGNIKKRLDYFGTLLFGFVLFSLMFILGDDGFWRLRWLYILSILGVAFLASVWFYFHEKKSSNPIFDFSLFKTKSFLIVNIVRFINKFCFVGLLFLLGFLLQDIFNMSVLKAGFIYLSVTGLYGIVSPVSGRMIDKVGPKLPIVIGCVTFAVGFYFLSKLNVASQIHYLILSLSLIGLGLGFAYPASSLLSVADIHDAKKGMASGVFITITLAGCSLGVIFSRIMVVKLMEKSLDHLLIVKHVVLTLSQKKQLYSIMFDHDKLYRFVSLLKSQLIENNILSAVKLSFVQAVDLIMLFCMFLSIFAAIIVLVGLKNKSLVNEGVK